MHMMGYCMSDEMIILPREPGSFSWSFSISNYLWIFFVCHSLMQHIRHSVGFVTRYTRLVACCKYYHAKNTTIGLVFTGCVLKSTTVVIGLRCQHYTTRSKHYLLRFYCSPVLWKHYMLRFYCSPVLWKHYMLSFCCSSVLWKHYMLRFYFHQFILHT